MTVSPFLRVVHFARKSRAHRETLASDATGQNRRDPAIVGYDVSPVHGRHCICRRCEQLADSSR
jgi:hypothetical protein